MSNSVKVENYRVCECGKVCKGRAALANHGRNCPVEQARSKAFIERIEAGSSHQVIK